MASVPLGSLMMDHHGVHHYSTTIDAQLGQTVHMACAHSELPLYMMHPTRSGLLFWHAGHVLPDT